MDCVGTITGDVNYFTTEILPKYDIETDIISLKFRKREMRKGRKKLFVAH